MKKYLLCTLFACIIILSGCNSSTKKITCTQTTTEEESTETSEITATFKGNDFEEVKMKMTYEFESEELANTYASFMGFAVTALESSGFSAEQKTDGKKIIIEADATRKQLEKAQKENDDIDDDIRYNEQTFDSFKEEMESEGYTCK